MLTKIAVLMLSKMDTLMDPTLIPRMEANFDHMLTLIHTFC